jgi:hypothetical protein
MHFPIVNPPVKCVVDRQMQGCNDIPCRAVLEVTGPRGGGQSRSLRLAPRHLGAFFFPGVGESKGPSTRTVYEQRWKDAKR